MFKQIYMNFEPSEILVNLETLVNLATREMTTETPIEIGNIINYNIWKQKQK